LNCNLLNELHQLQMWLFLIWGPPIQIVHRSFNSWACQNLFLPIRMISS